MWYFVAVHWGVFYFLFSHGCIQMEQMDFGSNLLLSLFYFFLGGGGGGGGVRGNII